MRNWFHFFTWWLVPAAVAFGATIAAESVADHFGWAHQMGPLAVVTIVAQFSVLLVGTLVLRKAISEGPGRPMLLALHGVLTMGCYPLAIAYTFSHFNF
jgi:hypothetical protein